MGEGTEVMNEPRITQARSAFGLVCRVELNIRASAERIWNILTSANEFPRWNSTVTCIEGEIRDGQTLRLRVPGSNRTFTPKVSGFVPNRRMLWTGGLAPVFKGVRTFELTPKGESLTDFMMEERFSGLLLPLVSGSLPDFGPIFERYAEDLRREAEQTA